MDSLVPQVAPAIVLSVLVGAFNSCVYVVLRGVIRPHLLAVVPAAVVGAYIGQAVGARVGDPIEIGDYSLVWASVMAWIGILLVASLASVVPARPRD